MAALGVKFSSWIAALTANALGASKGMTNTAVTPPELPDDVTTLPGTLAGITDVFDRAEHATIYQAAMETPRATLANQAMAAKLQSDILSQAERDFILQYVTGRLQATAYAAVRRKSLATYGLEQSLVRPIQQLLDLDEASSS